jgi:predicted DNA-binding protein YlxM (UPF0122 family)
MKVERNQEILELYKKGYSCSEIGKKYNISRQRISDIIKRQQKRNDFTIKNILSMSKEELESVILKLYSKEEE